MNQPKHGSGNKLSDPWCNRTAAAVLTGLPPGPTSDRARSTPAPCWAAAQTCPHPRAEIPNRCAAATAANSEPHASMEKPTQTGAHRRGAPQTRRVSRLLHCGITGADRRGAPQTRRVSRLHHIGAHRRGAPQTRRVSRLVGLPPHTRLRSARANAALRKRAAPRASWGCRPTPALDRRGQCPRLMGLPPHTRLRSAPHHRRS